MISMELLLCPNCSAPALNVENEKLIQCGKCSAQYPVVENIPVLLNSKGIEQTKKELQIYYGKEASVYNRTHGSDLSGTEYNINRHYEPLFQRYLPKGGRVLEFGCGTGRFSTLFKNRVKELYLTDFSIEMLLTHRDKSIPRYCADTERLPFRDEIFDCCIGVTTFCYLPDKKKGLQDLIRVLKPGGRIFILDQNSKKLISPLAVLYYLKHRKLNRQPQVAESHLGFLKTLFEETGLEIEEMGVFSWIPHASPSFLVRLMSAFDKLLSKLPFVKNYAMRLYIIAKKRV